MNTDVQELARSLPNRKTIAAAVVLTLVMLWSYWPTLLLMVRAWIKEPDYSHGFLVIPFALYLLSARRDRYPGMAEKLAWGGLSLILLSVVLRLLAAVYYFEAVDGYTLPIWIAGLCWFFGGRKFLRWCLPVVLFLVFMVPLPFRVEFQLSRPLQRIATIGSCWLLQSLGQPAVASGTTVLLPETTLDVENACSGLRLFMGFFAVSAAYVLLVSPPAWKSLIIMLAAAPIAVICNILRVTATGFAFRYLGGPLGHLSHDAAGWIMILLAVAMLISLLWYLNRLVIEVRPVRNLVSTPQGKVKMRS